MKTNSLIFSTLAVYFLIFVFGVSFTGEASSASTAKTKTAKAVIASYNPEARNAGKKVLEEGGNAFDAFVTTTLVEYVVAPGVTSLAGPLTALTFHKLSGEKFYLDAEMNHAIHPDGIWKAGESLGKGIMVPGALKGLEEIHRRYGTLPWSRLVDPAIELAENGFEIDWVYSSILAYSTKILNTTPYGRKTFFKDGSPLKQGDRLKQPELAHFLKKVASQGSSAMYNGEWAKSFISTVQARGGLIAEVDLIRYRAQWYSPRKIQYRGFDVYGSSGRSFGGPWSLLALKTIENYPIGEGPHFSQSADALELMVRTARGLWTESWLFNPEILDDHKKSEEFLTSSYGRAHWERIKDQLPLPATNRRGSHSYHVIVVDQYGNAITGTNTINSSPWGDGVFVMGVPLTNFISQTGSATSPGERRLTPMSSHLVFEKDRLKAVSGTFNSSLIEAGFQLLVNVLDYKMPAESAAHFPRFGTFQRDEESGTPTAKKNWLDPQVSKDIVEELSRRGLEFSQTAPAGSFLDTGSGAIVVIKEDESVEAGILPLKGHDHNPSYLYNF